MYFINWIKWAFDLLPALLRQTVMLAYVRVLLFPLRYVNDNFTAFAAEATRQTHYNSQTIVLEYILNRRYGLLLAGRKIYIDNTGNHLPRLFSFYKNTGQPALGTSYYKAAGHGPMFTSYYRSAYALEYDFTVMIPVEVSYDADEVKAIVSRYKEAGKRFNIQTYP